MSKVTSFFKKQIEDLRKKDIRWYIGVSAIAVSLILCFTLYTVCNQRLTSAIVDLGVSFAFYFLHVIGIRGVINPTVNNMPELDIQTYLPFSLEEVVRKLDEFPRLFFDSYNFKSYLIYVLENTREILLVLTLLVPGLMLIFYAVFDGYATEHKEVKTGTKLERSVNKIRLWYNKLKKFLKWFFSFYIDNGWIWKTLFFIWLINTNVLTIVIEFFAYYFYFVCAFDVMSVGNQLGKLVYDVVVMLWTLPLLIWSIIGYCIFDYLRKDYAYKELCHMERRNRGYINTLPIVILAVGPMGVGKTKTIVDMVLSLQNELRDRALRLMDKNMLRFPEFNFQAFEADLRDAIKQRKIKNLFTARQYIGKLREEYVKYPISENIWGYEENKFPHNYNNGLEILSIWKMLENYAQEYFVYSMTTSSIISNIAIRSDIKLITKGYFEMFDTDFFKRKPEKMGEESSYSHIIDWDLFRIGCQMNKENAKAGSFEFGVILASEIGKERQNTLELKETKKNSEEANQKNDMFNAWLKVIRHNATIENECFVYFVVDEQRPESWGADARDMASVLHILSISQEEYTLRFTILPLILAYILKSYNSWYHKVKKYGNENVYVVSLLRLIVGKLFQSVERMSNTYGYYTQVLGSEMGTAVSNGNSGSFLEEHKYFLMKKKIYSRRYKTDCFKGMFVKRMEESGTSLYDLPCYQNDEALIEELAQQNSYMAKQFMSLFGVTTSKKI